MRLPTRNVQGGHVTVDLLSSYLDNQVTPEQRGSIEQHVRTCSTCQTELQSLRQTVALMHALPCVPVPRAFTLSEAQVGRVPRRGAIPWYGGLARVAGVAAALVVIAAVSVLVLRSSPLQQVALAPAPQPASVAYTSSPASAPAAAPAAESQATAAEKAAPAAPGLAKAAATATNSAQAQLPTPAQRTATSTSSGAANARTAKPPAPTTRSRAAQPTAPALQKAAPSAAQALATAPEPAGTEAPAEPGAQAADQAAAQTPAIAAEQATSASGTPAAAAAAGAAAAERAPSLMTGRGGGNADSGATSIPAPPAAPISATLPNGAAIAYADGQGIWMIDRGGQRKLLDLSGATMPVLSPDRAWVAFWVLRDLNPELWAVRSDGSNAQRLVAQQDLPADGLRGNNDARQFVLHDLRWVPGTHTLAVRTSAPSAKEGAASKDELWNLDVTAGSRASRLRKVLDVPRNSALAYSPDGKSIALLERGSSDQPKGQLDIAHADGSGRRTALELPANPSGAGYDAQLTWLPDGRSLWVGVGNPDDRVEGQVKGVSLYRVPLNGSPVAAGQVNAPNAYWSPDGKRLAYTRPVSGTLEDMQLVLADADGSNARVYAPLHFGMFAGWAPDGEHFLYQSDLQTFLGTLGQDPQIVAGLQDPMSARWVSPDQLLYVLDQGNSAVLVSYSIDGSNASLATLPPGVTSDVVPER